MRKLELLLIAGIVGVLNAPCHANGVADPGMMAKLSAMYPKTQFNKVSATDIPGISRVEMGRNVAYVDSSGKYFFFGRLYDMEKQEDITGTKPEGGPDGQAGQVDVSKLNPDLAIKQVRGQGQRVLHVFTDPDCPYCRQLERSLTRVDNVTLYTYMMPLESLHPQARSKAEAVWCAQDPLDAWQQLMLMDKDPTQKAKCETPIDRILALATDLGINGTPTMISADGRKLSGARDAAFLNRWVDGQKSASLAKGK